MKNNNKDENLGNDNSFLSRWSKKKTESNIFQTHRKERR